MQTITLKFLLLAVKRDGIEELEDKFGKDGWKQLPDEVYRRYSFTPTKIEVEEHHVKVYASSSAFSSAATASDSLKNTTFPSTSIKEIWSSISCFSVDRGMFLLPEKGSGNRIIQRQHPLFQP